jgi:NAD(P)-dependent dehydrogenase (short-subunit alcohol dehydrogenase family)
LTLNLVSGFLATPLMGAYGASKHAMEALSDSLRMELAMYNVSVSMVEPGTIVGTRIRSKRIRDEVPAEQRSALTSTNASLTSLGRDSPYEPYYSSQRERLRLADEAGVGDHPTVVAEAVLHAIESPFPRARYLVGRVGKIPSWVVAVLARLLPSRFMDAALLAVMMRS